MSPVQREDEEKKITNKRVYICITDVVWIDLE